MRVRRLLLLLALAAGALVVPPVPHAAACSCAVWPADAAGRLPGADGAFVGALIARDDPEPVDGIFSGGTVVRYRYRVDRVVKGDIPTGTVDVWAAWDGAACGLGKPLGQPAGLLLGRDGDRWTSNLCSIADPDALAQAAASPPTSSDTVLPAELARSADDRPPDRGPILIAAVAVLAGAVTTWRWGRRRPQATTLP